MAPLPVSRGGHRFRTLRPGSSVGWPKHHRQPPTPIQAKHARIRCDVSFSYLMLMIRRLPREAFVFSGPWLTRSGWHQLSRAAGGRLLLEALASVIEWWGHGQTSTTLLGRLSLAGRFAEGVLRETSRQTSVAPAPLFGRIKQQRGVVPRPDFIASSDFPCRA